MLTPLLSALPGGTKTVFLAPEGSLASIPWGILPGKGRPLREKVAIRHVDTLAALLPRARVETKRSLLVVGGVD